MKIIDLNLPDLSGHPPPPKVSLGVYEKLMFDSLAAGMRPEMTDDEIVADFMRNEGSQTEPGPISVLSCPRLLMRSRKSAILHRPVTRPRGLAFLY